MELKVVSTGSRGNCYLLEHEGRILILDAGLKIDALLPSLKYQLNKVDAALITHEHMDHAKGVAELIDRGVPVIMTDGTMMEVVGSSDYLVRSARPWVKRWTEQAVIGNWIVKLFDVQHDAAEPTGFLIWHNPTKCKILYLTDARWCGYQFAGLTHIIIECNYIQDIIDNNFRSGQLSKPLYQRITDSHMSLETLAEYLQSLDLSSCQKIILTHLSDHNSDAARMVETIFKVTGIDTIAAENGQIINFNRFDF